MGKQKFGPALCFLAFVFTALGLRSPAGIAQTRVAEARAPEALNLATDHTLEAARQELLDEARAHKVSIQADRIAYFSDGKTTIMHAPITGMAKHRDADFEVGAPILFVMVKSTLRLSIHNGSYVVKAQYRPGATSGKATFTDRNGTVSAQRDLLVRTWKQSGVLFPSVYTDPPPAGIPNITSFHVVFWDAHGNPHYYVDCSGVNGTLYFEVG
jgi:hypothetical protein